MLVALHSVLKAGAAAGYEEAHQTIPDDLAASFEHLGIHNWTIWRSGQDLFHLVDCDDFVAAMNALRDDPANQRWQRFIGPFIERFETTAEGPTDMMVPLVYSLERQRRQAGE